MVLAAVGVVVSGNDLARWGRWLPMTALVAGYVLLFTRTRLPFNHRPGQPQLLSTLGPGTNLTLLRGVFFAALAGLLFLPRLPGGAAWLPALLYTASDLADYLDGYLARRTDHVTRLGELLDMEFDSLGVLLAVTLAIHYGQLPPVFLAVGLARYGFVVLEQAIQRSGRAVHPIPDSLTRRSIAGLQMGFLSVVLWPIVPPELALLAGWIFAVPFFASFGRDMLIMAGLRADSPAYVGLRSLLRLAATRIAPPILRLALVLVVAPEVRKIWVDLPGRAAAFAARGVAYPGVLAPAFAGLQVLALSFIAVGFLGRGAALVLILVMGLSMVALGPESSSMTAIGLAVGILILGTGPASLWAPEGRWLGRRAGSRR